MLESSNDELREQGISIVKNFATAASVWTPEGVVLVQGLGKERLLACLESILSASNENLVCKVRLERLLRGMHVLLNSIRASRRC